MPNLGNAAFNSLTIDTSASIELDGNELDLTSGNITRTNASSGTQSINLPILRIFGNAIWDLQGNGGVSVSSAVDSNNVSFTKSGSADLTFNNGFYLEGPVTVTGGNLVLNGGQGSAIFQGSDPLLITNQSSSLLVENSGWLATVGQPRIDNGGAVTVTGAGSQWSNYDTSSLPGTILVGRDGAGSLTISNGGLISTSNLTLSLKPSGNGTFNVTGGGQLTATNLSAGDIGGGSASIVVSGNGSVANVENLTLGTGAPASLLISAGGAVNVMPTYPSTTMHA